MKRKEDTVTALLDSTVRVIARDGLDKTSIRAISADCNIPNPYIYLHFHDKDALLARAFEREDEALAREFIRAMGNLCPECSKKELRCRTIWEWVWNYMTDNLDNIRFYIQYRYSGYYLRHSQDKHRRLFSPIVERLSGCFQPDMALDEVFQQTIDTMLSMAVKVYSGSIADTADNRENLFRMTIGSISPFVKKDCLAVQPDHYRREE